MSRLFQGIDTPLRVLYIKICIWLYTWNNFYWGARSARSCALMRGQIYWPCLKRKPLQSTGDQHLRKMGGLQCRSVYSGIPYTEIHLGTLRATGLFTGIQQPRHELLAPKIQTRRTDVTHALTQHPRLGSETRGAPFVRPSPHAYITNRVVRISTSTWTCSKTDSPSCPRQPRT